jgi:activating signal cointegrator complex subunit 3
VPVFKGGEVSVAASLKLLIVDEVHLLNDERGPVIETLIARTHRQAGPDIPPPF